MSIRRVEWLAAAVLAASMSPLASLAAQADTSFQVARDAVIEITMRTGRLSVRGEDRATAELRGSRTNYEIRSSRVGVVLDVNDRNGRNRSGNRGNNRNRDTDEADVVLIVPRSVRLVVNGTSTDVSIANVAGDVEVTLVTGDFEGRALGGRAILQSMTGDVKITEGVGDLRVTTTSGDVSASGVRGEVEVGATSGDVSIGAERLGRVKVALMSGDIDITGPLADDARLQLNTHSGDVILRLPESAAGELEVTTYNGNVSAGTVTMMPPVQRSFNAGNTSPRRYQFGGGGTARITVSTFNGDIAIQRGAARPRREE